ncbi:integrase domain containing protein [Lasius niger]|uniref:Integrase domain containing protein n=1 Tax=Lasius niger TaxID=67767 RepID=A0A0J7KG14_LASNI|nr:integrase domain containing protein [Lasius niger]
MDDDTEQPITHAATSLSKAEKNYAQIEREALALTYAVKKFHRYIYGRRFELRTDHKPLVSIFGSKGGIPVYTANRLQRYALILLAYDFDIRYIDTKSFAYADFLSRLIASHPKPELEDVVVASIRPDTSETGLAIDTAQMLPVEFGDIQRETEKCGELQEVASYVAKVWPRKQKQINNTRAADYFVHREGLSVIQGCLFYGERIIIPEKYRKRMLDEGS